MSCACIFFTVFGVKIIDDHQNRGTVANFERKK